ncbi:MAG TPA: tetratricopeptide repeat protein [Nitrospirae bacterium]|nr:tetratricopeptide repeat protein [Nitrospirota bacterium]
MASKFGRNDSFSNRRFHLIILFLTALTLRLIYFVQSSANPLLYTPVLDETYYIHLGKTIAGGFWMGEDRLFFMDPLYGYFLGSIFYFFGDNLTTVRLLQILIDSFNVVLICLIGEKVWSRQAGVMAALFYAVYKVSFYYTLLILKTTGTITLSLLFTLTAIGAAKRGRKVDWFLLGLFAGALTFFRANLLLMAPLAVMVYWFVERPRFFQKLLPNGAMLMAGLLAVLSIGAVRNYMVSGEVVFLNTQTGRLLYSSNNPCNLTGGYSTPSFSRRNAEDSETDFHKESERRLGRKLSAKEVSGYWVGQTIDYLRENPGAAFTLLYNKIKATVGDYEIPNNFSSYIAERFSSLARAPLPTFAFAFALGIPGLALGLAGNRKVAWALLPLITSLVTILIFYTSSRFRIPAVPSLLIGSGVLIVTAYDWMKKKETAKAVLLIAVSIALAAISLLASNPQPTGDGKYFLARAYWNIGDLGKASAVSGESAIRFPRDSRFQMLSGMIALSENRIEDAINQNLLALKINPSDADAHHNLGLAYHAMGRNDEAVESLKKAYLVNPRPKSLYALARIYDQTGDKDDAISVYRRYLSVSRRGNPLRERAGQRIEELRSAGVK